MIIWPAAPGVLGVNEWDHEGSRHANTDYDCWLQSMRSDHEMLPLVAVDAGLDDRLELGRKLSMKEAGGP